MSLRSLSQDLVPPMAWRGLKGAARALRAWRARSAQRNGAPDQQDLEIYWDPKMAAALEHWGEGNAWLEIQIFMSLCTGRVLDIACGTGRVMAINARFPLIEVHGCDISGFLIDKAKEHGIDPARLRVCDARHTGYPDAHFNYAYSIGSLEHFTEPGIVEFLQESRRITARTHFHHIPTSRSGRDHGWITPHQSYFNNTVDWWLVKFRSVCSSVHVLDSTWQDDASVGKWFVCSG
jgi:SAM-dependent methyltransferase